MFEPEALMRENKDKALRIVNLNVKIGGARKCNSKTEHIE